tara:strand:+ start:975 stop:2060 length:1086 start_codon:yes stop_codon:yes gene_type:complete
LLKQKIAIVGAGIIGQSTAWQLAEQGHEVILFDPKLGHPIVQEGSLNGSQASLGILMGNIFTKSRGRSWKLRKESMEIWPEWIKSLNKFDHTLRINTPLVKLAKSKTERLFMEKLQKNKKDIEIEILSQREKELMLPDFEWGNYGGIISYKDGRIDAIKLQKCIISALKKNKVKLINNKVISIKENNSKITNNWKLILQNKKPIDVDKIILCNAIESNKLLNKIGHNLKLEGVLGQALTINCNYCESWPAVLNVNKFNLIKNSKNELIIGSTLEANKYPNSSEFESMKQLHGIAPKWIKNAKVTSKWYGIRAKPIGQPAPVLKEIEPGLIIATAHYRNGVLLAPATVKWIENQITKNIFKS